MFTKLRLSLTRQIEDIEKSIFAMVVMYSAIGYITAISIALPLKSYQEGTLTWSRVLVISVIIVFLLFFYYTRYRMIVDDKDDSK